MTPLASLAFTFSLALAVPAPAAQSSSALPPVRFRAVVLETHGLSGSAGNEEARCINSAGETAGQVFSATGANAARWSSDGKLTDLGVTGGCAFSSASGISDSGAVVGASVQGAADNAFLWTLAGGTTQLPLPKQCYPAAILDDGTVAFTAILAGLQPLGVLWNPASSNFRIVAAGSGDVFVRDLSAAGGVAGHAGYPGLGTRAFRWTPHQGLVNLEPPVGFSDCTAYGLSDHGVVVGVSVAPGTDHPTVWDASGIGTPLPFARATSSNASAFGVNSKGWVVGYEIESTNFRPFAVLWVDGVAHELSSLIRVEPGQPAVHVLIGWDVNEKGQIAARGMVSGVERALRLDPL
jgi:uncharacterized membrane protein